MVAVIVDVLFVVMEVGLAVKVIVPTPAAGDMVIVVKLVNVEELAVTVTDPATAPAVRVTIAFPFASVDVVGVDKVAAVLFNVKLTKAPVIGFPPLSLIFAVIVEVPLVVIAAELAVMVMVPPAIPPVIEIVI